ncbi:aminoglycoside phosphotransferase family protein [Akkermansia glycaniphila]|uniref:phosphotransferase enzyme family protein n=1 Tax=Akkermansia glycaniphila TaxID=1679444 RepID=UPI001C01F4FF|nr:aminoglycoside phosphotransferase family protein [Akkermansia glycaniphila]MBT9449669.1 aminoglycoside phosphotransferase family protein [Akkermansia glycaniphila]
MHDLRQISNMFDLRADFVHGYSYGSGHINDTYCVWVDQAGLRVRYILQRLAQNVFKQPIPLMNNVKRVTDHALARLLEEGCPEAHRRTLTLIPGKDGKPYVQDAEGNVWRVYPFIERARTYDTIETTKQCIEAARAFGNFQKLTADLPGEPLFETIPDFHNTTSRMNALKAAIKADPLGRVKEVQKEIDWYLSRDEDCHIVVNYLASGELPLRCTHNDTKLNNVMLDDVTGEGICVIDLDTTMPGSAIYDFGDMVRTATSPAAEDEKDTSLVTCRMFMFEALVEGYLDTAKSFLTPLEKSLLPFSGKLLTMECGIRFLTDYLSGDVYFKIKRPEHNLDRCRTQMALVESIEKQMDAMQRLVDSK